jgi:hypothetical protein
MLEHACETIRSATELSSRDSSYATSETQQM